MSLPDVIENVVNNAHDVTVPHDTVIDELRNIANQVDNDLEPLSMSMAIYMLGFSSYNGFKEYFTSNSNYDESMPKRLYEYMNYLKTYRR